MISEAVTDELRAIFGDRLLTSGDTAVDRGTYDRDMVSRQSLHQRPAAVVLPESTAEVAALVTVAIRESIPITARGAGSGLAGGAIAAPNGIVCSMERMNRVRTVNADDLYAVVEPGVITRELDAALAPHGLFFAGYPMSEEMCTIGGNVATNAGGGRAVKYGVTGNHVLGLEVVTGRGEVLTLGGPRIKDVTGLNLLPLFVGSEGTLGIVTAITLRLTPRPAERRAVLCAFSTAADAITAVSSLRRAAVGTPSSIEYIDGRTARGAAAQLWRRSRPPFDPGDSTSALLLVESEGTHPEAARSQLAAYEQILGEHHGTVVVTAHSAEELETVWKLRKAVPWWVKRQSGEYHSVEDVVVPSSQIGAIITRARELEETYQLDVAIFGHAGDGNFHINPMKRAEMAPETWEQNVHAFCTRLYEAAVALGGTISGEHGIGRKRTGSLSIALGQPEIAAMHAVRAAFDPHGILNPGVLLP